FAAFSGPPGGPAQFEKVLREVDRLIVTQRLAGPIATHRVPRSVLKRLKLVCLAMRTTQRIGNQPGEHRARGKPPGDGAVVDHRTAERHQRRVKAQQQDVHDGSSPACAAAHLARSVSVVTYSPSARARVSFGPSASARRSLRPKA